MIRKAIMPVAGLGTQLLPITKEHPKEMMHILREGVNRLIEEFCDYAKAYYNLGPCFHYYVNKWRLDRTKRMSPSQFCAPKG